MKRRFVIALFAGALFCWLTLTGSPAFAGPGGAIASALFKTPAGRVIGVALLILLTPLIIYVAVKEAIAEKRTLKDLKALALRHPEFDWMTVKEQLTEAFHRVHAAWRKEDMAEASRWMTDWYWQNQQIAYLDQWERDGLINQCRVREVKRLRPMFVRYRNQDGNLDESRLIVSITANMEDYLEERATGKIVKGAKGYSDTETVWTFIFKQGRWVVANIEPSSMTLTYAGMQNEIAGILAAPNPQAVSESHR